MKGRYLAKHYRNTEHTGLRRLLSVILCLCLLTSVFQLQLITANAITKLDSVTITHEGKKTEKLTLPQNERATFKAECSPNTQNVAYQWQILADIKSELWVNIYDATNQSMSLSYAMLGSLLDESGSAHIRCRATAGENSRYSEAVCVTVAFNALADAEPVAVLNGKSPVRKAFARAPKSNPEYVDISINYLDAVSGQPIYTGFTAQIEYGTSYYNTVISPTYLGYAPFYNAADPSVTVPEGGTVDANDDATVVTLNIPADYTAAQYVVNVYYKAIDVPYAVRYYFQNINDDMYTENMGLYRISSAKTGTIISNEQLAVQDAETVKGFTKLYHYPEAVAADGSTVFQCYYDRNYYMVKFDMNGGYGTEPIYARYGTPFVVNAPTRHGYVFDGWDDVTSGTGDNVKDTLPDTVPDENRTYKALWSTVDTTYTAVYWLQNADNDEYSYVGNVKKTARSGITVSGEDDITAETNICGNTDETHTHSAACKPDKLRFSRFDHADQNVTVAGDGSTIVNVYYARKEYTLRFYYAKEYNPTKDKVNPTGTETVYSVVGGSTYKFGHQYDGYISSRNDNKRPFASSGNVLNDIESLLYNINSNQWGAVEELPTITPAEGVQYTTGVYPSSEDSANDGYTNKGDKFHYLEFTARYGADLTKLWPSEVFDRVPIVGTHTANGAHNHMTEGDDWGKYAYFAGWNGEYNVKYNWDNTNATIKCYYPILNETLLYDSRFIDKFGDPSTINFLAFYDNGANIQWSKPTEWIYELYLPLRDGENEDGLTIRTYKGKNYKLYNTVYANDDNDGSGGITHQTYPPLPGFKYPVNEREWENNGKTADGRHSNIARFYYTRQSYSLTLHNYNEVYGRFDVPYNTSLDPYTVGVAPDYPATLEQNAYTFGGWYNSPGCFLGSEYKVGETMPAKDIGLYAKWTPVNHTVRFFRTYDDMIAFETTGNANGMIETREITHGSVLGSVDNPSLSIGGLAYTFGGWFYMRAGNKTAYTPLDMPVTTDMNVFADWGTHSAQPYRIHYALHEGEGDNSWLGLLNTAANSSPKDNKTYKATKDGEDRAYVYLTSDNRYHCLIAPDSAGFAYQGNTRTFYPKAGEPLNELYPAYNSSGYYPTLASHSIAVEYEGNKEEPEHNVFTFTYVHAENIAYRVEYRYADTGALIASAPGGGTVTKYSTKAVVTERFEVIKDYIPDAFYKRLILAVTDDGNGNYVGSPDNVAVFYYSKNTQNAFYAVHHMLQKVNAAGAELTQDESGNYINYTESDALTEGIGDIGSTHDIVPQTFSGFTVYGTGYIKNSGPTQILDAETNPHFTVTVQAQGTELYIFYTRNTQSYKVYYLKYGTDISNLPQLTDTSPGVLRPIESGTGTFGSAVAVSAKPVGGMNCVSNLSQTIILRANDAQNYIIFYYAPLQYTVEYKVWQYGGGTLSQTIEVVNGTNLFSGSTATAKIGYRFDGWYADEACTVPVGNKGTVTGSKLVPTTLNLDAAPKVNTFWAKFVPVVGNMTIVRENGTADEGNGDRVFVYRITAADDPAFELYVSIRGNGSVTIKNMVCREYMIEQQSNWSWRYNDTSQKVTVSEGTIKTVTFDDAPVNNKWLNGNSERIMNRKG